MSSDVAAIRAEIKAWERSFKETNGREPTIDDIKKQPAVAQKYKLYKKLSKAATIASNPFSQPNEPPSTPPRQTPSGSKPPKLLHSASRLVETTAPLASFNPFSPQKKDKGKQKAVASDKPISNPFASPRKPKEQSLLRQSSPFPLIQPTQPSTSSQLLPEPPSAISRARKRLRGEPVSPSPNKEKRRRIMSPADLPFPKLQLQGPGSSNEDSGDDEEVHDMDGTNSSFVDDSPMKPTTNGKAFTLLFEETAKPTSITDLFGGDIPSVNSQLDSKRVSKNALPSMDDDLFKDASKTQKSGTKSSMKKGASLKSYSSNLTKSRSKLVQMTLPNVNGHSDGARKESPPNTHASAKRVLPAQEVGSDNPTNSMSPSDPSAAPSLLLPPSPNPNTSRPSGKSKPNGARSHQPPKITSRKKAKLRANDDDNIMEDMEGDGGGSSDGSNPQQIVKHVHYSRGIHATLPTQEDNSEMEDPVLNYSRRVQPRGKGLVSPGKQGGSDTDGFLVEALGCEDVNAVDGDEKAEGDLPHELRRVLVLESLKSKKTEYEESMIVKRLLSGRRVLHYDPQKGGEIWGVGEEEKDELAEDDERGVDQGDDEWEGDPIPWEISELSESRHHSDGM